MNAHTMKAVLTIAGSDSSGGAGIQADIKTIAAHKLFAECVITALTAQNTCGVYGVENITPAFIAQQIDVVYEDIRPDAVKIGMVSSPEAIGAIHATLKKNDARNIVIDPVMVATSGSSLIENEAVVALAQKLIPMASVITPNIAEAEVLSGMPIACEDDMVQAARIIAEKVYPNPCTGTYDRVAVLVKGGHSTGDPHKANDFLLTQDGQEVWLLGERIDNPNTHGTGCTLSSAIACGLARGESIEEACRQAKAYVAGALASGLDLGRCSGPLDHMWEY